MAAGAAAADSAAEQQSSSGRDFCCCCFCRHGLSLGIHCCRSEAAESSSSSPRDPTKSSVSAYASMVLFAASVAVVFARAGIQVPRPQHFRGLVHPFHARKRGFFCKPQDRKPRFAVKKYRKSHWEWRPVNRRSAACQTAVETATSSTSTSSEEHRHSEAPPPTPQEYFPILSPEDFPVLTRESSSPQPTISTPAETIRHPSPAPNPPRARDYPVDAPPSTSSNAPGVSPLDEPEFQLTRKQRKHLKKKQKKLLAASHTLHLTSLPVLKSWKPSSSRNTLNHHSDAPCKIYDCSKTFTLGSPSRKAIAWSPASSRPHDYLRVIASGNIPASPSSSKASSSSAQVHSAPVCEISEISESPKSYPGDWADDNESNQSNPSLRKSVSEPEEIEVDAPSVDSEFEADSEDYSLPAF